MNGTPTNSVEERRKYVMAFNATMVKIWREQMALLGVIDTGALYRSTVGVLLTADGKFIDITLSQAFNTYPNFNALLRIIICKSALFVFRNSPWVLQISEIFHSGGCRRYRLNGMALYFNMWYSSAAASVGSEQRRISTRSPRALVASVVMAFCVESMRLSSVQ